MKINNKHVVYVDLALQPLITFFIEETKKDLETLFQANKKKDFKTLKILSHNLVGECESYGFRELGQLALHLERQVKKQETHQIDITISKMNNNLNQAIIKFEERTT